jgi:type IV pilus assembly protein PilA
MGKTLSLLAIVMLWTAGSTAQQAAVPQTARQALLEMFFSKTQGTFIKHLPAATRIALENSGAMSGLQQYSLLASQLQTPGQNFQTFETGSVLLSGENPKTGQKVDITVEKDVVRGNEDDIELSIQTYKDGKQVRTPFMPHMTFSMKQEAQIWKLNEISVTIRLPLADPDLLKAFTESIKNAATARTTNASFTPQSQTTAMPAATDDQVLAAMRTILSAEVTYTSTYPKVGFTCTLSDLDGFGGGEPNEHQAMLINSGLASGKRYGYVFALSGCGSAPATAFRLSANPNANTFGRKVFCADQSAVIRSSDDGSSANCFARGTPAQ